MVDVCGYELPTNLQNFTKKDLTEVKIFQKVVGGGYFFETPGIDAMALHGPGSLAEKDGQDTGNRATVSYISSR